MAGLKLTRDQLRAFIKDPRTLKQFEKLIQIADELYPPETLTSISSVILGPEVSSEDLRARVMAASTMVELLAVAPRVELTADLYGVGA